MKAIEYHKPISRSPQRMRKNPFSRLDDTTRRWFLTEFSTGKGKICSLTLGHLTKSSPDQSLADEMTMQIL